MAMTASRLIELAERCEQASGPDREMDFAIATGVGLNAVDEGHPLGRTCYDANGMRILLPRYSASLDAAMSLAEPFLLVALSAIAADGLPGCCIVSDTSTNPPKEHWGISYAGGENIRSVLARTVTAACLRALAQEEK